MLKILSSHHFTDITLSVSYLQCCTLDDHSPCAHSRAFGHGFFASPGRRHGLTWPSTMLHVGRSQPGKQALPPDSKTKQAPQMWGLFRFGIRQCPTLPGVRPWLLCVHWTPPWPHLAKYNAAHWPFTARVRTPGRSQTGFIGPGNLHSRAACGTPCSSRRSASLLRPQGALGSGPTGRAGLRT